MEGLQLLAVQERDCLYNEKVVFLVYVLRWGGGEGWKERKKEGKKSNYVFCQLYMPT